MNVKELKEKLAGMPDDMPVVVTYAIVNKDNSAWHMTPSEPPYADDSIASCSLGLANLQSGKFVLIPTLLANEILRRLFEDGDIDG